MNCQICHKRPAAIYLTHNQINKLACWHCTQLAVTAVREQKPIYRFVTKNAKPQPTALE